MKFTEAQNRAINAKAGTLLVSAGAGSGKTSVLTERIINKICNIDYNITDFLVVTFTRASATDLKNKISGAINKRLSEDINNAHLKRQQILLGRASISTIHSFCLDLIRANFEKLGLPAKFRLADENETSIIKRNLLDDLLDEYYAGDKGDFVETIENFLGARDDENIYGVILKLHDKITSRIDGLDLFDEQIKIMREIVESPRPAGTPLWQGGQDITQTQAFSPPLLKGGSSEAAGGIKSFFSSKFGAGIRSLLWDDISGSLREIKKITAQISSVRFEVLDKKYSGAFDNIREFFLRLAEITDENYPYGYNDAYNLCRSYANVKVGSHRIDKDDVGALELKESLDKKNKHMRDTINRIQRLFSHDFDDIKRFAGSYERSLAVLKDFTGRFDADLLAEKMRLKSFEFSDLERFAVKLLVEKIGKNGEIYTTDLARQIRESYREIYIDEYQDTNKMQDIIFRAISSENDMSENGNRFMVGDIKQSIYAFRGAKPDIFAGYSKMFGEFPVGTNCVRPPEENGRTQFVPTAAATITEENGRTQFAPTTTTTKPHKIYLRKNFRSGRNIIDFINYVFERLFSEKLGGVEYTGGEVLESGRDSEESGVKFALIEKIRGENLTESDITDDGSYEDPDILDSDGYPVGYETEQEDIDTDILESIVSAEAEYAALTIRDLLDNGYLKSGVKILPRHITVLMRNYTKSGIYADALKKYGIACYTDRSKGFLSSAEIMLVVSLLRAIDNPMRDIDLAAVLKSPVFMFTLDDLIYVKYAETDTVHVRAKGFTDPLFRYVQAYADAQCAPLQKKCADFIAKLNLWRAKSRLMPVDRFIWYLYRQTDIMAKISLESFAAERKANLMLLYEYARKFEETTFKGLYGFLNYLNDVQAGKDDFERAKVISENSDVVKIMSIHKAKGLEFPVCILANTGGIFNNKDYTGNPVMTGEGVYFDLKSDDEIGIEKTPFKKLFAEKIKSDMLSEEARILYVALTRAADRLIITGSVDNIDRFLNKNTGEQTPAGYALTGANNMLKWLAPILLDQGGKNKTDIDFDVDLVRADRLREMITTGKRTTPPTTSAPLQGGELDKTPVVGRGFPDAPQIPLLGGVAARSVDGVVLNYAETLRRMYDFEYGKDKKDLSKVPAKVLVTKLKPGILSPDQDEYAAQALKEIEMSPLPRFLEETAENIPALAGTAAHIFMQFADFEYAEVFGAQNEAENLLSKKFMTEAQYSRIKFYPIDRFFASDLYSKIKSAKRVYRETPFNLKDYVGRDDYRLIQGAIDLFFEDKDGRVYVVDFKTDQVHKPDGEKVLIRRHKYQIEYYCKAVSEILGKPVDGAYIYSFALNQAIEVI